MIYIWFMRGLEGLVGWWVFIGCGWLGLVGLLPVDLQLPLLAVHLHPPVGVQGGGYVGQGGGCGVWYILCGMWYNLCGVWYNLVCGVV